MDNIIEPINHPKYSGMHGAYDDIAPSQRGLKLRKDLEMAVGVELIKAHKGPTEKFDPHAEAVVYNTFCWNPTRHHIVVNDKVIWYVQFTDVNRPMLKVWSTPRTAELDARLSMAEGMIYSEYGDSFSWVRGKYTSLCGSVTPSAWGELVLVEYQQ